VLTVALRLSGQTYPQASLPETPVDQTAAGSEGSNPGTNGTLPAVSPISGPESPQSAVDWSGLFRPSSRFLGVEHGFRLLTEPGTRTGLKGSFFDNYGRATGNLHGWADGDPFYVNYVGHPMQGSVAGFLWVQHDGSYRNAEFGRDRLYWRSRLRAAAFAWAYSEQFEIGPFSEASIGKIQSYFPQQGFVDHVITPTIGLAWMIAEDAVDKYLIERIEGATGNRYIRMVARSALNPSRSFANVLENKAPWHRDTRSGILSFVPGERQGAASKTVRQTSETGDATGPAPFELAMTFQPERFLGGGRVSCLGGGGSAMLRISDAWQLAVAIGGCKMMGLAENLSGDSLSYMAGPRWRTREWGRWSANLQVLVGGNKLTEERMYPETKALLEAAASRDPQLRQPSHADYTDETAANGFAVSGSGGVSCKLNNALAVRIAELGYQHSWAAPLWGRRYSDALSVSAGLVLRMGTW